MKPQVTQKRSSLVDDPRPWWFVLPFISYTFYFWA